MKCPICHQEIKDSSRFCPKCGKAVPRCPKCGKVIYRRTRFCTNDGMLLPESVLALLPDDGKEEEMPWTGNTAREKTGVPSGTAIVQQGRPLQPQKKKSPGVLILALAAVWALVLSFGFIGFTVMRDDFAMLLPNAGREESSGRQEGEGIAGQPIAEAEKESVQAGEEQIEGTEGIADAAAKEAPDQMTGDTAEDGQAEALGERSDIDAVDDSSAEAPEPTAEQESPDAEDAYLNHRYELIIEDVTWQEAFDDCIQRGGYLVRINSEQEFQYLIEKIEEEGMQDIHFYLGGRRKEKKEKYRWIDEEGKLTGSSLNPDANQWTANHWMVNEPSFLSDGEEEMYMNLIYYHEDWVLNDVPLDITRYYPGKTAYICEYNE